MNGDGAVTTADALGILKYLAQYTDLDDNAKKRADVNGDNNIQTGDALDILKKLAHYIDKFEAEA